MPVSFNPEKEAKRLRAAIDSVKGDVRGLPHTTAIHRLEEALRSQGAYLPADVVSHLARTMSDPWWPVRHPLRALRPLVRRRATVDSESVQTERQANELAAKLDPILESESLDSYSNSSRRPMDGMVHVVAIQPWSDRVAERIRFVAAPVPVKVHPLGK